MRTERAARKQTEAQEPADSSTITAPAFAEFSAQIQYLASAARTRASRSDGSLRFYRPELDVVRFLAFLIVFICHIPVHYPIATKGTEVMGFDRVVVGLVSMGAFGVDLFFVLSAYLITSLLLRERDATGTVDVRRFYARRILRIWPLYFGFLVLSILIAWSLGISVKPIYFFSFFVLLGNFAYPALVGSKIVGIIGPLWSISLEEQFYLVWPNVVRYASREWIVRTCIIMLVVSALARLFSPVIHINYLWENTFTRLDPIAVGILIAVAFHPQLPSWHWPTRLVISFVGLGLWIVAAVFYGVRLRCSVYDCVVGYPLVAVGGGAMLLAVLGIKSPSQAWWWRVPRYLGKISYGLYVFHGMMMTLTKLAIESIHPASFIIWVSASLVATITAAALSYRYYETPFLRFKNNFAYVASRPI